MAEASSQSSFPTLAEELGSIAARAQTYTGASGAAIALGEGSAEEMICRACSGPAAPDIGASIRLEGTFTGMAVQSGQALRCDDSDTDKRVDAAACRALGTRSIVVVPIRDADTEVVAGVLAVFAGSKNAFNDLHVAVLRTMAREVAVAVQKARKQGVTLSTMSMPAYVEPAAPVRPSSPGFKPPVTSATPRPSPVPTPPPMPSPSAAAAAPKPAPVAEPAPTMMSSAPRPAAPPPPPPPAPAKLAPPVPPPPPKEDPSAPQPMAAPIRTTAKAATPPAAPEWKPAPPPPPRKADTPVPFDAHKATAPAPVSFGTFDNVAADKKPGGGGMMIWIGVAAVAVLIIGGYFAYSHFSGGAAQPQQQATQPQQQQAASTPAPTAASPTPAPAATTTNTLPASQPAASPAASKAAAPPSPAPQQQAAKPAAQTQEPPTKPAPQPAPQQEAVARTLSTPTPGASAPRQEDIHPLPVQTPQVAVPITTSAPRLAAAKVSQSTQAQLISSVQPKYPEMARTMHASGDVVMSAVIGKDGAVKSVKVISGHPLLRDAAANALRQWRYKPATLDGQPVEATTQVTVKFAPR